MLARSLLATALSLLLLACASAGPGPNLPPSPAGQPSPTTEPATSQPATPTGQPSPSPTEASTPTPQPTPTPEGTPISQPTLPPEAEQPVRLAKEDLARKLGIPVEQVKVVKVEAVEWSDTSLGCPESGKMYAQVITPGYRVTLEAAGITYEYHTDKGSNVVECGDE